jgi:hypothetical protein
MTKKPVATSEIPETLVKKAKLKLNDESKK